MKNLPQGSEDLGSHALVGTVIAGKYRVIEVLSEGVMGHLLVVEPATRMIEGRLVLRLVPLDLLPDGRATRSFLNNLRLSMKVVHGSVVPIRDVGQTQDGQIYFTMDHCPGETLAEVLKRVGRLPLQTAAAIALRTLSALKAIHAAGAIHASLSPRKVKIVREANRQPVRLLDFGTAALVRALGQRGNFLAEGPRSLAPEHFLGEKLDRSTDTYLVGALLYECLTGQRPYPGGTAREIYQDLKSRPVAPPDLIHPPLASFPDLCAIVCRALERNPDRRYLTTAEFHRDLERFLASLGERAKREPTPWISRAGRVACGIRRSGSAGSAAVPRLRPRTTARPKSGCPRLWILPAAIFLSAFLIFISFIAKENSGVSESGSKNLNAITIESNPVKPIDFPADRGSSAKQRWQRGEFELHRLGKPRAALESFAAAWRMDQDEKRKPESFLFLWIVEAFGRLGESNAEERDLDRRARACLETDPLEPGLVQPLLDLLLVRFDPRSDRWDLESEALSLQEGRRARRSGTLGLAGTLSGEKGPLPASRTRGAVNWDSLLHRNGERREDVALLPVLLTILTGASPGAWIGLTVLGDPASRKETPLADTLKILGFAGSLRKNSYNRSLLRAAVELAPPDTTIESFDLEGIPLFNQDLEGNQPAKVKDFKARIRQADAVLIVTPEYNYSIPGVLKNAIDCASRPYGDNPFDGKPVAITGASVGPLGSVRAQYHLRQCCMYLNMFALNRPEVLVGSADKKFDDQGKLTDPKTRESVGELLKALAAWTRKLKG